MPEHIPTITPFAEQIAGRQYFRKAPGTETVIEDYDGMLQRVARHVARAEALEAYKKDNGRYPEWYMSFEGRRKNLLDLRELDAWIAREGYTTVVKEWEDVFLAMLRTQKFSPGGRILAGAESAYGQLMNCLQGGTLVHTIDGHVPIRELHGPTTVLSQDGEWRDAYFKSYGTQELWEVEFINGQRVQATENHLWLIPGPSGTTRRIPTKDLLNENVLVQTSPVRPSKNDEYWNGVRHGLIYGDGTKNGEGYTYSIRSFVEAERVLTREVFAGHTINETNYSGRDLTSANYRPEGDINLKELPEESASDSYWYGFFCGFFAAAGGIDARGSAGIYQSSEQVLQSIAKKLPFVGIMPGQVRVFRDESNFGEGYAPNYRLTILKQTLIAQDFLREDQQKAFTASQKARSRRPTLKVTAVRPLGFQEEVYCCEEPATHSFVIEGGILTSNCFVLGANGRYIKGADDADSIDGIYELSYKLAKVTKTGGGCGISLSAMRESGSHVNGSGGKSSGPVSFLRHNYNPTLRVIKLEGVRRGAGMATLRVDHPDVLDFITAKDKDREDVEGDIESFNISLLITDEFMNAVAEDTNIEFTSITTGKNIPPSPVQGKYHLPGQPATSVSGNPTDAPTSKEIPLIVKHDGSGDVSVKARWLWQEITEHAWQTGDPGVLFVDRINEYWPFREVLGELEATNPCGEEPLWFGESCCLGSLILDRFVSNGKLDTEGLRTYTKLAIRFLDNVLTINVHPIEDTMEWCDRLRRVGLGVMGDAVAIGKLGFGHATDEAMEARKHIAIVLRESAEEASIELASERGAFPFADKLPAGIKPRRNVHMLSIAPTGTISMVADTTSGIEPIFALAMQRRVGKDYKFRLDPTFEEYLRTTRADINLDDETLFVSIEVPTGHDAHGKAIMERMQVPEVVRDIMHNHGGIRGLAYFDTDEQSRFQTAHEVTPAQHVSIQGVWQRNLDGPQMPMASISKTVNMLETATAEDVRNVYAQGYAEGLKGITIYLDGSRDAQVLRTDIKAEKPKPEDFTPEATRVDPEPRTIIVQQPLIIERPRETEGKMIKAEFRDANGKERKVYVYIGADDLKYPVEVFVTDEDGGPDIHPYATALGKMISMSLKHGTPPAKIARKLMSITGGSVSYSGGIYPSVPALIGKLLQKQIDSINFDDDDDDDIDPCVDGCNPAHLIHQGGCTDCPICGRSKCS